MNVNNINILSWYYNNVSFDKQSIDLLSFDNFHKDYINKWKIRLSKGLLITWGLMDDNLKYIYINNVFKWKSEQDKYYNNYENNNLSKS